MRDGHLRLDQTNRRETKRQRQRNQISTLWIQNRYEKKRKKRNLHLIDIPGPFLDGNVLLPSRKVLSAQHIDDIVHDHLCAFVVLGHLHLRHSSAGHAPTNVGEVCGIHVRYPVKGEPETIRESPPSRSAFAEQRQTHAQPGIPFERTGMADSGKRVSKTTRGESEPRCPPRKSVYAIGGEHDTTGTTRERRADSRRERERCENREKRRFRGRSRVGLVGL